MIISFAGTLTEMKPNCCSKANQSFPFCSTYIYQGGHCPSDLYLGRCDNYYSDKCSHADNDGDGDENKSAFHEHFECVEIMQFVCVVRYCDEA